MKKQRVRKELIEFMLETQNKTKKNYAIKKKTKQDKIIKNRN